MSVQNIASWEIMENLETEFLRLYNLDIGQKWFCRSLDQLKTCPQITGYLCQVKYLPTVYYTQRAIPDRARVKYEIYSFKTFREKRGDYFYEFK